MLGLSTQKDRPSGVSWLETMGKEPTEVEQHRVDSCGYSPIGVPQIHFQIVVRLLGQLMVCGYHHFNF